jgi:putative aldouronate transport system permease protein
MNIPHDLMGGFYMQGVADKSTIGNQGFKKPNRRRKRIAWIKKWSPLFIMMIPGLGYLIINNYVPMLGLVMAFKNMDFRLGILASPWAGFDNFRFLFATRDAWIITRNTVLYNFAFIVVNLILGVTIAIFISDVKNKTLKKMFQGSILFPFLMSSVIIGYIVFAFLSMRTGFINNSILPALGMDRVFWYNEPRHWPPILIFVNTWRGVGYGVLVYIAAINGIDPSLYESAVLDGASKWKQIRSITLPLIKPTVVILLMLGIGRIFFSDFGLFYQVPRNSGLLFPTTNVIDTYVFRGLMVTGNIGMSTAAGFYQSIVGFILVLGSNALVRKFDRDSALF